MRVHLLFAVVLSSLVACEDALIDPLAGGLAASPARLDFGQVFVGHPAALRVALRAGARPVRVARLTLDAPAFRVVEAPTEIAAGTEAAVMVTFDPQAAGPITAALVVDTDAPATPQLRVALTGEGAVPPDCDDHQACTGDAFDPASGACAHTPREGACDDGSACTTDDTCSAGACVGQAVRCDDGVDCTDDTCDPAVGCVARPAPGACADGDPCTLDRCTAAGCDNPPAPDGTACGEVVSCVSAHLCLLHSCVEVSLPDGVPCDDGDACTSNDACAEQRCVGQPTPAAPTVLAEAYRVPSPIGAAFLGDALYLSSGASLLTHARAHSYRMERAGALAGPAAAPLEGTAVSVPLGGALYARVSNAGTGTRTWARVEVLDASDAAHPRVVSQRDTPGLVHSPLASYADGALFFCRRFELGYVDLQDPLHPGAFVPLASAGVGPCDPRGRGPTAFQRTAGDLWAAAWAGAGAETPSVSVHRVTRAGVTSVVSHAWNPSGVHAYGGVTGLELSEERVVVALGNPRLAFVFSRPRGTARAGLTVVEHGLDPSPVLLAVEGQVAWYFDTDRLAAVDLADPEHPRLLSSSAPVGPLFAPVRTWAADADTFVLSTGDGVVLVDRAGGPPVRVVGTGEIEALTRVSTGYAALTRYAGAALYRSALLVRPTATSAPAFTPAFTALPKLLDGGQSGLAIASEDLSSLWAAGCARAPECRAQVGYSFGPVAALTDDLTRGGAVLVGAPSGLTTLGGWTARGCQGLGLAGPALTLVETDLCGGTVRFTARPEWGTLGMTSEFSRGFAHGDGVFSFLSARGARLVSTRLDVTPSRVRNLAGPVFGAGYHRGSTRWVLSAGTADGGGAELWIHQLGEPDRHFRAPDLDEGGGTILAVTGRAALVAGAASGRELLVYDLDGERVAYAVSLSTPPLSAELEADRVVVGRPDGVTVFAPLCLPR